MNHKEARAMWVELLRSGEFKQGQGALRNSNDERCCLGVACDGYARATGRGRWFRNADDHGASHVFIVSSDSNLDACGVPPLPVLDWFGLRHPSGYYETRDASGEFSFSSLLADNDVLGKSFEEIADIIESEPERLFVKEEVSA